MSEGSGPSFDKPPVVEVALGIQFEPLEQLRNTQIALYGRELRDRFPRSEEHWPLDPAKEEREKLSAPRSVRIEMKAWARPPVNRFWFLDQQRTHLIQIQADRFVCNWRNTHDPSERYPRYTFLKKAFEEQMRGFRDFLSREDLGHLKPTQWEVTYVNHIVAGEGWDRHGQIQNVFAFWSGRHSDEFLQEPEDASCRLRYGIRDEAGAWAGRLNVELTPAFSRSGRSPMFVLKLTARGAPSGEDDESILRSLDIGHDWVVRGFCSITTEPMHQIWRRLDA
jgi:uncharacterized protein (TIGR04255 family)